jgi:glycosyltransferase involved in cell wall biosynthesis
MPSRSERVDIVLPVHNEAGSIAAVLREFHEVVAQTTGIPLRFVVSEDCSRDNTVAILQALAAELPILLLSSTERRGYSGGAIAGLRAATADVVSFIDSDGQCDPRDFARLHAALSEADLVIGWRRPRRDPFLRRVFSGAFGFVYRRLFPVKVHDPSCPFIVVRRPALERILAGRVGVLKQGFWWEFVARATALGVPLVEMPIAHRSRLAGQTQIYRPTKILSIGLEHVAALFTLRRELQRTQPPAT